MQTLKEEYNFLHVTIFKWTTALASFAFSLLLRSHLGLGPCVLTGLPRDHRMCWTYDRHVQNGHQLFECNCGTCVYQCGYFRKFKVFLTSFWPHMRSDFFGRRWVGQVSWSDLSQGLASFTLIFLMFERERDPLIVLKSTWAAPWDYGWYAERTRSSSGCCATNLCINANGFLALLPVLWGHAIVLYVPARMYLFRKANQPSGAGSLEQVQLTGDCRAEQQRP